MLLLLMLQADPQDNVEELCVDMQRYVVEHYITGSQLMLDYNEQVLACVTCWSLITFCTVYNAKFAVRNQPWRLYFSVWRGGLVVRALDWDWRYGFNPSCCTVECDLGFLSTHICLCRHAVEFDTSISCGVHRHTVQHTCPVSMVLRLSQRIGD